MESSIKEALDKCEEKVIKRAARDAYTVSEGIQTDVQRLYYETVLWCIRRGARLMVEEMYNIIGINADSHEPQETDDRD